MNTLTTTQNLGIVPFIVIEQANLADTTRKQYRRAIELYLQSGSSLGNADQLTNYALTLKSSPKAFLKFAIKLWSKEVERVVKSQSTPDTVNAVMATIHRLESLIDSIKVKQQTGNRVSVRG